MSWTDEMDLALLSMWNTHTQAEIGAVVGRTQKNVYMRSRALGLVPKPKAPRNTPTFEEWHAVASEVAQERGLKASALMGHCHLRRSTEARWEAWRRIKAANPKYSLAGIGRASGFDHTSLVNAFRRMGEDRILEAI